MCCLYLYQRCLGHVCGCCQGQWHPGYKGTALTCSEDGTPRILDMYRLTQKTIIKPNLRKAGEILLSHFLCTTTVTHLTGRVAVTCCTYNTDGILIVGGLRDGSIQIWGAKGERVGRSAAVDLVYQHRCHIVHGSHTSPLLGSAAKAADDSTTGMDLSVQCFATEWFLASSRERYDKSLLCQEISDLALEVHGWDDEDLGSASIQTAAGDLRRTAKLQRTNTMLFQS